jgi:hypothetical protein
MKMKATRTGVGRNGVYILLALVTLACTTFAQASNIHISPHKLGVVPIEMATPSLVLSTRDAATEASTEAIAIDLAIVEAAHTADVRTVQRSLHLDATVIAMHLTAAYVGDSLEYNSISSDAYSANEVGWQAN